MPSALFDATLGKEALETHIKELALRRTRGTGRCPLPISAIKNMAKAQTRLAEMAQGGEELLPASAWFLDNYPYLEEVAQVVRAEGCTPLPAHADGTPRAFALMKEAVAHADAHIDEEVLALCARAYMDVKPLQMQELWSLPKMARIALLKAAEAMALDCVQKQALRARAARWAREQLLPAAAVPEIPDEFGDAAALEQIQLVLQGEDGLLASLQARLAKKGISLGRQVEAHRRAQALAQLRMAGVVMSLHRLSEMDFSPIFEELCQVEEILRQDPGQSYADCDFESRDRLRRSVAQVAAAHGLGEGHVAKEVIRLCRLAEEPMQRQVAHYLGTEAGLGQLSRALGKARPAFLARLFLQRHAKGLYGLALCLLAALALLPLWRFGGAGLALLSLFPAISFAQRLGGALFARIYKPRLLLKLNYEQGIPARAKTAICMPVLLSSAQRARDYAGNLEKNHLANPQAGLCYILLGDFSDHSEREKEGDGEIIHAAMEEMHRLNLQYGERFYFLHRPRKYSLSQEKYMGWERKRGAIRQLNQAILSGSDEDFCATNLPIHGLRDVKYVITLDADTVLPPGGAAKMAGAADHPINRRHGVLAPRAQNLHFWGQSVFSKLMSGKGGVDTYVTAVSETYQDLCGEGIFGGKGIYNVRAFEAATAHLPQNAILSHDMLEGLLAGAAQLSDVCVYETQPQTLRAWAARQHRWVRGDWQLLPFLFAEGINGLGRWKIFDNMRRSLSPLFAVLAAVLCGPLGLAALYLELGLPRGKSWLVRFLLLPWQGVMQLNAAATSLWRICISRKGLLSWVTAADVGDTGELAPLRLWACPVAAAVSLSPLLLPLWGLAPLLVYWLAKPAYTRPQIPKEGRGFIEEMAQSTYHWFERVLCPDDNFLPPDNVQEAHGEKIAHRTSPTNIGLALCSHVAAHDLGLISAPEMARRIACSLESLERLETWNGMIYNWYDTKTLEPLQPKYVSAVDNGNLGICLWAAEAALEQAGEHGLAARLAKLARQMDTKALYDEGRNLFYIGFDVGSGRMSAGHYDLLASESRLLSLFAMIKGDVPVKHYLALGRPQTAVGRHSTLLSWSGTMFEYLMPSLFFESAPESLLHTSEQGAVQGQIQAARREGARPWGESESGFAAFDLSLNYQYRAFGLPGLSMRGGVQKDVVVSPYSAALALLVDPVAATKNLQWMKGLGWLDEHGFFEAADYTADRRGEEDYALVRSHMAHHQGMALLAMEGALGGRLRGRFMALPRVKAFSVLLSERAPDRALPRRERIQREQGEPALKLRHAAYTLPRDERCVHPLAGDGTMLLVNEEGIGHAERFGNALWRVGEDGVGLRFFLDGQPLGFDHIRLEVDKAILKGERDKIRYQVQVAVSPEDGAIVADAQLNYPGPRNADAHFAAYLAPVLAKAAADRSHKTYSDLFLQAEALGEEALRIKRRARANEETLCMLVQLAGDGQPGGMQASKEQMFGPGGGEEMLQNALVPGEQIKQTPVEPCAALGRRAKPQAGTALRFLLRIEAQMQPPDLPASPNMAAARCFEMAAIRGQVEIATHQLGTGLLRLAGRVLAACQNPALVGGARAEFAMEARLGQSGLWRFGISGDQPFVAAFVSGKDGLKEAAKLGAVQAFLALKGFAVELVFIDDSGADYFQGVKAAILAVCPGAVCLAGGEISGAERALLGARAAMCLFFPGEKLEAQLPRLAKAPRGALPRPKAYAPAQQPPPPPLEDAGDCGGFVAGGQEYLITHRPPRPWSNVMANPHFGSLVTSNLGGYTWYKNARMNRLTPFSNDPILDPPGEGLQVVDEDSKTPLGLLGQMRYGQGYAVATAQTQRLWMEQTIFVHKEKAAKEWILRLRNRGTAPRRLRVYAFAKWVLGEDEEKTAQSIITGKTGNALTAFNGYGGDYTAYLACLSHEVADYSCDWGELPQMAKGGPLSQKTGTGCLPGALIALPIYLPPGEEVRVCFALGAVAGKEALAAELAGLHPEEDLAAVRAFWDVFLEKFVVETPSARLNRLVNRWLPYQVLSARLWGRTGFYQSGGAYGFRDQLQDAMMLAYYDPALLKEQILLCAAHQFEEGDVQHWWHPKRMGVRTKISDDLLFLPWAACHYIRLTGDAAILEEKIPFLKGPMLDENQEDMYYEPELGAEESLYVHLIRAVRRAARFGEHGLCLMGGGDWNDAMNLVGIGGKGESVFVSFLLCLVIGELEPYLAPADKADLLQIRQGLKTALDERAFDGQWYIRAYFDSGKKMGSKTSVQCQIDLTSQAMAVLSGVAVGGRDRLAMDSAMERLAVPTKRMIKLLDPPFDQSAEESPGYIAGYVPGVRENGGQYTHAAAWAVLALAKLHDKRAADALLQLLPTGRVTKEYLVEPYVAAADIYAGQMPGRGGWTWYTGSAAWLWRAAVEGVCGYVPGKAGLEPCPHPEWEQLQLRTKGQEHRWER